MLGRTGHRSVTAARICALLGVPFEGVDERVRASGSMNRKVKHGKRSPSVTQPLKLPQIAELTSVSAAKGRCR
jgi:hypothetical protein